MPNRTKKLRTQRNSEAKEFARLLSGGGEVLVTTHVAPDGDAIASLMAAGDILEALGCLPVKLIEGRIPGRFQFLEGADQIRKTDQNEKRSWHRVLSVDAANRDRIGEVDKLIAAGAAVINVDHHDDNTYFGSLNIVRPDAASTTEIFFDIAKTLDLPITKRLATYFYAGLLTDTGGFRYSNTTDHTFELAAELIRCGAQPNLISKGIFSSYSEDALRMLGEALSTLKTMAEGRVATMSVQQTVGQEEIEDLAEYALKIKGVQASALFRLETSRSRVSLRGRGNIDVARIARKFGGGGHPKAAGFSSEENREAIQESVVEALIQEVEEKSADSD